MTIREELDEAGVHQLAEEFERRDAEYAIRWALEKFRSRAAICTSFQAEGMVILDMATRIDPGVRVFTIDTGRMPKETHELVDRVRERYGIRVEVHYPDFEELTRFVSMHGTNPFYRSQSLRQLCCEIRKVRPLIAALSDKEAWITGVRRSQTANRAGAGKVELDKTHGNIVKVNPLADWSEDRVWEYIRANDVPYNELYDKGFTSIGCAPCTRATQPGEDPRAGRWWWEDDSVPKECGIHLPTPVLPRSA
ncbi:MAG: phosphoadenylyl-sulfate reductase [Chloroflexi bacterium]|nr:phosphoadenylyl-sulfate reductase [Chloroflexota bacterium]